MADIFLSYAKEDREAAHKLSMLLEGAGWSVWWDRRIPAGRTWRDVLEEALRSMGCMVVLWSSHSVDSDWVKEEAEEARSVKKLVPVLIDAVNPPVGFRAIQAADLTDWDGASESVGARQLIADLELLIGKPAPRVALDSKPRVPREQKASQTWSEEGSLSVKAKQDPEPPAPSRRDSSGKDAVRWKIIVGAGVALALALGVIALWRDSAQVTDEVATAVATVPTRSTPETPPAPKVVTLGLHAARHELEPKESLSFSLRGHWSDGAENEITSAVEWSSSNTDVAMVDAKGRITALQPGLTDIIARHSGVSSPPWQISVKALETKTPAPKLVSLAVNANKKDLAPRERIALRVTGGFSDGSKKSLSGEVVWSSSDAAVASVNAKGELEAWRAGKTGVVARLGEVTSAPFGVVVKEPPTKPATGPEERKSLDYMPGKIPDARPVAPQVTEEPFNARIASQISRARDYRVRGNYRAALAELEASRVIVVDDASA
ncbi:MAG TPA: TIR domain-containing protein, partial [Candidatus Binatia bacterium]